MIPFELNNYLHRDVCFCYPIIVSALLLFLKSHRIKNPAFLKKVRIIYIKVKFNLIKDPNKSFLRYKSKIHLN